MIAFRISMFLFSGISIMISVNKCYEAKTKARYKTFQKHVTMQVHIDHEVL